jgi:hypothetical protein
MGTGVGEAMLIGAAVGATAGGAGAAIQGGDPLQGALMGGATGAIGGGLGSAFAPAATTTFSATTPAVTGAAGTGAATGATTGAATGATTGAATGATSGAVPGAAIGDVFAGFSPTGSSAAFNTAQMSASAVPGPSSGITALSGLDLGGPGAVPGMTSVPQALPSVSTQAMTTTPPAGYSPNIFGYKPGDEGFLTNTQLGMIGGGSALQGMMQAERNQFGVPALEDYESSFDPSKFQRSTPTYAPEGIYRPEYKDYKTAAEGGIMRLANGGPVERMSMANTAMNPQGGLYPMGMIDKTQYAVPTQRPVSSEMVMDAPAYEKSSPMLMAEGGIAGMLEAAKAQGLTPEAYQQIYGRGNAIIEMQKRLKEGKAMASGGISSLGSYSDGGRMLKGPGDGMSDSIPGVIANKQPARLADGEFVVPADVVSHLGNGSTDAGAKQLYSMMDKVRKARTGKKSQGKQINPNRYMPA